MRNWLVGVGVIAACAGVAAAGCTTKACTLIGCTDGFSASVRRADGSFPAGMHRIEVTADGVTLMCTFTFAETSPGIGQVFAQCPAGLGVMVSNALKCTEIRTDTSVSQRCDPIPGQFVETISLPGTPAQVHAWQYVGDAAILDAAAAPSYADYFPNGPECGGACRQASASWTMQ
jgi:hypothetical protein